METDGLGWSSLLSAILLENTVVKLANWGELWKTISSHVNVSWPVTQKKSNIVKKMKYHLSYCPDIPISFVSSSTDTT